MSFHAIFCWLEVSDSVSLGFAIEDEAEPVVDSTCWRHLATEMPESKATAASVRRVAFLMGFLQWNDVAHEMAMPDGRRCCDRRPRVPIKYRS